jgi:hypothetical protein
MLKMFWRRASLSMDAPLGNLEGSSFIRDFERWMKGTVEVGVSLRELCEGYWRGAPLLVTPKDMLSKALELDV